MPNIGDYHYGFHCGAKQLKNMTDYEKCALFELILTQQKEREEKPSFVQGNNFRNSSNEHLL